MKQPSFTDQILQYLFLRKKNTDAPKSIDLRFMHGMNRISILLFLFALCVLFYRFVLKR